MFSKSVVPGLGGGVVGLVATARSRSHRPLTPFSWPGWFGICRHFNGRRHGPTGIGRQRFLGWTRVNVLLERRGLAASTPTSGPCSRPALAAPPGRRKWNQAWAHAWPRARAAARVPGVSSSPGRRARGSCRAGDVKFLGARCARRSEVQGWLNMLLAGASESRSSRHPRLHRVFNRAQSLVGSGTPNERRCPGHVFAAA